VNQEPTGSTLLKRRQVSTLDDIHIVSVQYWEWNKLGNDHVKKQQYLRAKLNLNNISIISVPNCEWIVVRKGRAKKQ
jgi:asparagine synthetase A